MIPDEEAQLVESRLEQPLRFKHRYTYNQVLSQKRNLEWLLEIREIDQLVYEQQVQLLTMQEVYCDSLAQPDLEDLRRKRKLPDFILNAIEGVNKNQPVLEQLQRSAGQIKDLPIKPEAPLVLLQVNAAADTVNALVPAHMNLERPEALVNFSSEDIKTGINRIARLVNLDPEQLRKYNVEPLSGKDAYKTLLALLLQHHFIRQIEKDQTNLSFARAYTATGVLMTSVGVVTPAGIATASFLNGYTETGIMIGMISLISLMVMSASISYTEFSNARRIGIRRVLGLK